MVYVLGHDMKVIKIVHFMYLQIQLKYYVIMLGNY